MPSSPSFSCCYFCPCRKYITIGREREGDIKLSTHSQPVTSSYNTQSATRAPASLASHQQQQQQCLATIVDHRLAIRFPPRSDGDWGNGGGDGGTCLSVYVQPTSAAAAAVLLTTRRGGKRRRHIWALHLTNSCNTIESSVFCVFVHYY